MNFCIILTSSTTICDGRLYRKRDNYNVKHRSIHRGLSIENYHRIVIFVWLERIFMLWGVLTWWTSRQLCITLYIYRQMRYSLLANDSLQDEYMTTTNKGHSDGILLISHALTSSCRRWVFWAMQRRHQSPMAMPTKERLVVNSFAAASKRRVCCIRQDIRLHQRSRCPIRRERWLKPCRCTITIMHRVSKLVWDVPFSDFSTGHFLVSRNLGDGRTNSYSIVYVEVVDLGDGRTDSYT